jgi:hypothetical protein
MEAVFTCQWILGIEKQGLVMRVGREDGSDGRSFEKSAHLLVESPGKRAFVSTIQTDRPCTPRSPLLICPSGSPHYGGNDPTNDEFSGGVYAIPGTTC